MRISKRTQLFGTKMCSMNSWGWTSISTMGRIAGTIDWSSESLLLYLVGEVHCLYHPNSLRGYLEKHHALQGNTLLVPCESAGDMMANCCLASSLWLSLQVGTHSTSRIWQTPWVWNPTWPTTHSSSVELPESVIDFGNGWSGWR